MKNIHNSILMTMASILALSVGPREAVAQETCGPELIPLVLTGTDPQDPEPYPIPTCSKCRRLVLERQSTASGTHGELGLVFHGEAAFEGVITVTVVLVDGTMEVVTIGGVSLDEGDEVRWQLEGPSWEHAEMAWLTFVPAT